MIYTEIGVLFENYNSSMEKGENKSREDLHSTMYANTLGLHRHMHSKGKSKANKMMDNIK